MIDTSKKVHERKTASNSNVIICNGKQAIKFDFIEKYFCGENIVYSSKSSLDGCKWGV